MKRKFVVDVVASFNETITVSADSQDEAEEMAHEIFAEDFKHLNLYGQDTYDIGEV